MRASTPSARPHRARPALLGVLACVAVALAGCSSNSHSPTAPIVITPGPPGPMMTVSGDPRVNVNFQGFANRIVGQDTLSGYFYVTVTDSLSRRQFVSSVTLNGVAMRAETDGLGTPLRYSLLPTDLDTTYDVADTLRFAFTDTSGITPPFGLTVVPSTIHLAPDTTRVSQAKDLLFSWNGAAERVQITLSDHVGGRVSANLSFDNVTGASQVLIRSQDLKQLQQGPLNVSDNVLNTDSQVTARARRIQGQMSVLEARVWTLVP